MNHLTSRYALLFAIAFAILPKTEDLPIWLNISVLLCFLWRIPAIEQRLPLPNTFTKAVLVLASLAAIKYSYNTWFGPEAGTAFLILCVALKLLETRDERDCYVVLTLAYFVLASHFLFSQSLLTTLYIACGLLVVTTAYISFNQSISLTHSIKKAFVLLGQALPLMLILYVFFPRLPPLWSLKLSEGSGKTGMSDYMSPGDLAKLSQSSELAFRVEFLNQQIPPKRELYWRGLTFSHFDGTTWRPSRVEALADINAAWVEHGVPTWAESQIELQPQQPKQYKVILEATDQVWLYSLAVPYSRTHGVGLTRDFRLINQEPIFQRFSYEVLQFNATRLDPVLPHWLREDNLQLPRQTNPVAQKMAHSWRNFYGSDEAYIKAILRWFTKSEFYYTLSPPLLQQHRIDDFLFNSKRGFCEHYSSAFTFLLRAAGIPARVVVGYQGGTLSPTGDSWQVRQMDAHAWVEAWLPHRGWIRFDPTAAIAPDRIEQGMGDMANNQELWGSSALSTLKYNNYKMFSQLRNMVDYMNYRWQKDIVGYDVNNQDQFLLKLLGDSSIWKRIAIMFGALILIATLLAVWTILRGQKRHHPADKIIIKLSNRLEKRGLQRHQGEGIAAYLQRLQQLQPHWQQTLLELEQEYCAIRYQENYQQGTQKLTQIVSKLPSYQPQKTKEL